MENKITTIRVPETVKDELKEIALEKEPMHLTIQRLIKENEDLKKSNERTDEYIDLLNDEYELKIRAYEKILPNPLTLIGVEYLLRKNIINELPLILSNIASVIVEFSISANKEIIHYSDGEMKIFVEKSELLIKNIQSMMKEYVGDSNMKYALNLYCGYLANCIGKYDEYKDSIEI